MVKSQTSDNNDAILFMCVIEEVVASRRLAEQTLYSLAIRKC